MSKIVEKYLWVEKYRPKELSDMVLSDSYRDIFSGYISRRECPSLLFIGSPGSGKTTVARILIDKLLDSPDDLLTLNGSSQTGIDVIRDIVEEFLKGQSFSNRPKIVFIDEFDGMSSNAQAALRGIIEQYHETNRFIFTANYKHKILTPMDSRFTTYEFKKLDKDYVLKYCKNILDTENVKYDDKYLQNIVDLYYPDVRKMVNQIQGNIANNTLVSDYESLILYEEVIKSELMKLIDAIRTRDINLQKAVIKNVQQILMSNEIDYIRFYENCFYDKTIPLWAKIVINEFANKHITSMIPALNLVSCLYQVYKAGEELARVSR